MLDVDLEYEPGSLLPPCSRSRIGTFEKWLSRWHEQPIRFPESYVAHVVRFHGGAPRRKCFTTAGNRLRFVCRFLNFLSEEDLTGPIMPTWRVGVNLSKLEPRDDLRLDYTMSRIAGGDPYVNCLGPALVPFAVIDTCGHDARGMAEFDLLCFDYRGGRSGCVVTFSFHESWVDEPVTEDVADSFDSFLGKLHRCPASVETAHEPIESF